MSAIETILKPETRHAACDTHGAYDARRVFNNLWSRCPACSAEVDAAEKADREQQAKQQKLEAWQRRIGDSGIPDRFQDRSLQSYVAKTDGQRRALAFAESYADGFDEVLKTGRSALFIGRPGTGKTHLAAGIGLRLMHRDGRTVLFSTVVRAIRRVKDTWGRDSRETQAIAALVFPDLLILDEVGVQFGSETERLILFDVLNERYEKRRPTLLLSNFDVDAVRSYLGERIFDRLREDGGDVVVFDWESHRGAEKKEP
jgi:DNA replication protein DnaC